MVSTFWNLDKTLCSLNANCPQLEPVQPSPFLEYWPGILICPILLAPSTSLWKKFQGCRFSGCGMKWTKATGFPSSNALLNGKASSLQSSFRHTAIYTTKVTSAKQTLCHWIQP